MGTENYSDVVDIDYMEYEEAHNNNINSNINNNTTNSNNIYNQIDRLDMELYPFGYTFWDIERESPHKSKERSKCADAIRTLIDNKKLMSTMLSKGSIPVRALSKMSNISSKVIESHEGYIVMTALILTGNYPDLQLYFDYIYDEE